MNKRVIFFWVFILIFSISFLSAQTNSTSNIESKAKQCINGKIAERGCANLGIEDKIFSVLSLNKCKTELLALRRNGNCFGRGTVSCELKETAQATLALSESGTKPIEQINWLLSQNKTADGIDQLIQIETLNPASCNVKDSLGGIYQVSIDNDKRISMSGTGNCLNIDSSGYWLNIAPSCTSKEFEVSCNEGFSVSILFKSQTSEQIYVLEESPKSTSALGIDIINRKEVLCFKRGNSCDYEGTLWASIVLKKLNYNFSSYLPYLIVFSDEVINKKYIPESFLYYLTGGENFRNNLIQKQKANSFWDESSGYGRYYDTAVAMLPITKDFVEREGTINWLGQNQGNDGCWDSGSISKTGFLLYSVWANKGGSGGGTGELNCVLSGNFCVLDKECSDAGGSVLQGYIGCSGLGVCCNKKPLLKTCEEEGGEICQISTQECFAGTEIPGVANLSTGQICCTGYCGNKTQRINTCEQNFGLCTTDTKCPSGKKKTTLYSCDFSSEICCITDDTVKGNYWWLWVLGVLIILIILAIIFREKLKSFYGKLKFKKTSPPGPQYPSHGMPLRPMLPQRRILPVHPQRPMSPRPPIGTNINTQSREIDEVLKKLKEMGK